MLRAKAESQVLNFSTLNFLSAAAAYYCCALCSSASFRLRVVGQAHRPQGGGGGVAAAGGDTVGRGEGRLYGVLFRSSIFVVVFSSPVLCFGEEIQILWLASQLAGGGCLSCFVSVCLVRRTRLDDCGCGRGGGDDCTPSQPHCVSVVMQGGGGARYDCTTSLLHRVPDANSHY